MFHLDVEVYENKPNEGSYYWHYVDGKVTK